MAIAELGEQEGPGIPANPPYIPPSLGNFVAPPERGPDFPMGKETWPIRRRLGSTLVELTWTQHWKRVSLDWVPCGHNATTSHKTASGVTQELATELSGNVGIELGGVATIGLRAAVKRRIETSETREHGLSFPVSAPKCARLLVTAWQVIDVFVVRQTPRLRLPLRPEYGPWKRYQLPTDVIAHRTADWPDDTCCPRHREPDTPEDDFIVSFQNGQVGAKGVVTDERRVTLDSVEGNHVIGGAVPLIALADPRPWLAVPQGAEVTFGILSAADDPNAGTLSIGDEQLGRFEAAVAQMIDHGSQTELLAAFRGSKRAVGLVGKLREDEPDLDPMTEYSLMTAIGSHVLSRQTAQVS